MKPWLISCIPLLAMGAVGVAADEPQMPASAQAASGASGIDVQAAADRVREALRADPAASKVSVATHASTVLLTGTVRDESELLRVRTAAEKAAAGARVTAQVEVDGAQRQVAQQDSQLARDVEAALKRDRTTASLSVLVTVDDQRRVVLLGPVPTAAARADAQRVAAQVPGVTRIENRLVVPE